MTHQELLLICLGEECSEIRQRIDKALRFGLDGIQPNQDLNNKDRIMEEINDFLAVWKMLVDEGILTFGNPNLWPIKENKVMKYLNYSSEIGILK